MHRALLVVALALVSCDGTDGHDDNGCGDPLTPGVQTLTITVDGVERTYVLFVPANYDPNQQTPLVFAWHDSGRTAAEARAMFMIEAAAPVPAIFVYPQGLAGTERGWDLEPDGVDVAFYDALSERLRADFCVGPTFSTGYEFGAYLTNKLGCLRGGSEPGSVTAIAPVAGGGPGRPGAPGNGDDCRGPIPAAIMHGVNDFLIAPSYGQDSYETWRWLGGCQGPDEPVAPGSICEMGTCSLAPVEWCFHSGGHVWPSVAPAEMWALFQAAM